MLELKNVSKEYKKKDKKIEVIKNINYNFEKGKLYCIIGKSGAGKTTLIQIMGLLLKTTNGKIIINNKEISNLSSNEISDLRNKEIGFVFQSFYLNPLLNAYENVMLPIYFAKNISKIEKKKKAFELLEKLGLKNRENHYAKELSGGEQQRVAIARALINNPNIILADEPTGSLDSENEKNILEILKNLAKNGKCVIIVSHNEVVKKYADKVLAIEKGCLREVTK